MIVICQAVMEACGDCPHAIEHVHSERCNYDGCFKVTFVNTVCIPVGLITVREEAPCT